MVKNTLSLDESAEKEFNFQTLLAEANPSPVPDLGLTKDNLATLIYTSGTTVSLFLYLLQPECTLEFNNFTIGQAKRCEAVTWQHRL